jgi:hypothetical protein
MFYNKITECDICKVLSLKEMNYVSFNFINETLSYQLCERCSAILKNIILKEIENNAQESSIREIL